MYQKSTPVQNRTADLFADEGYDIEMLPEVDGGNSYGIKSTSNPDYLIEGKAFDCYSPEPGTDFDSITRTLRKKSVTQAERLVLNLDGYPIEKVDGLMETLLRRTNGDLKHIDELFIVRDNVITRIFLR